MPAGAYAYEAWKRGSRCGCRSGGFSGLDLGGHRVPAGATANRVALFRRGNLKGEIFFFQIWFRQCLLF